MSKLLICGVDDSAGSREATRVAARLADGFGGALLLVHVGSVPVVPGASGIPGGQAELAVHAREKAERLLERVAADAAIPSVERRVAMGSAVEVLSRIAAEEAAALFVVGSRGQGQLRGTVFGSVSSGLCRSAPCPVVVVPPGAGPAAPGAGETLADA